MLMISMAVYIWTTMMVRGRPVLIPKSILMQIDVNDIVQLEDLLDSSYVAGTSWT